MDQTPLQALPIDDEDSYHLVKRVEASFGIELGGEAISCLTAGDLFGLVLARLPAGGEQRLCATSMAFYGARSALHVLYGVDRRAGPDWRLDNLAPRLPRRVFEAVAMDLAVEPPSPLQSVWGRLGVAGALLGFAGVIASAFYSPLLWPSGAAFALGVAALLLDPGRYGPMTLGDLARKIALENFGRFAEAGADSRPATVWRALTELMGREADCEPARIAPETRLLVA